MAHAAHLTDGYPVHWPNGWSPEFAGQRYPGDLEQAERQGLYRKVEESGIASLTSEERARFEAERCFRFWHFGSA